LKNFELREKTYIRDVWNDWVRKGKIWPTEEENETQCTNKGLWWEVKGKKAFDKRRRKVKTNGWGEDARKYDN